MWQVQVHKIPFRVTLVSDMLQRKIDEMFHGLPNIFGIADDILIAGFDDPGRDHDERVDKVLEICMKANLKLNKDKCHESPIRIIAPSKGPLTCSEHSVLWRSYITGWVKLEH